MKTVSVLGFAHAPGLDSAEHPDQCTSYRLTAYVGRGSLLKTRATEHLIYLRALVRKPHAHPRHEPFALASATWTHLFGEEPFTGDPYADDVTTAATRKKILALIELHRDAAIMAARARAESKGLVFRENVRPATLRIV